jgi:CPA2 family monovalent cation:H+ antiporter-2
VSHYTPLIATIVGGIVLAFVLGALANRLKLSPIIGYLLAGVAIGPATPGFIADQSLASELAEIGVILLMFGVGMHFSLKDLLSVRAIAIPGAVAQIATATGLGWGLAYLMGWSAGGGLVFGLALSVASTVVLLRAMQERRMLQSDRGRIAVGWLIVEDIAMVLALVLLPPIGALLNAATDDTAGGASALELRSVLLALGFTIAKVTLFVAIMLVVGRRVIPWVLHYIAHTGSRELFRLGVLAIGLGVAYGAAQLFGVSFALGAFFAGMVLAESELSQRAAEESLPLRDAFAVLFFVSVGMLFDPEILLREPFAVVLVLLIIMIGKSIAAFAIVKLFRHPAGTAALVAASLAQIGEFSFILAALGVDLGLIPDEGRDLIITGAIVSIVLNPLMFLLADRYYAKKDVPALQGGAEAKPLAPTALAGHIILVGFGRVGRIVGLALKERGEPILVIEDDHQLSEELSRQGIEHIVGNAVLPDILTAANIAAARMLIIAIPSGFEAGAALVRAKELNPGIRVIARAHFDEEVDYLTSHGAEHVIMGEKEIAHGMLAYVDESRREPAVDLPDAAAGGAAAEGSETPPEERGRTA